MGNPLKIHGICPMQNNIPYTVLVSYIESKTFEGADYAKDKLFCDYNETNHTCKKHQCPMWVNAPQKP